MVGDVLRRRSQPERTVRAAAPHGEQICLGSRLDERVGRPLAGDRQHLTSAAEPRLELRGTREARPLLPPTRRRRRRSFCGDHSRLAGRRATRTEHGARWSIRARNAAEHDPAARPGHASRPRRASPAPTRPLPRRQYTGGPPLSNVATSEARVTSARARSSASAASRRAPRCPRSHDGPRERSRSDLEMNCLDQLHGRDEQQPAAWFEKRSD